MLGLVVWRHSRGCSPCCFSRGSNPLTRANHPLQATTAFLTLQEAEKEHRFYWGSHVSSENTCLCAGGVPICWCHCENSESLSHGHGAHDLTLARLPVEGSVTLPKTAQKRGELSPVAQCGQQIRSAGTSSNFAWGVISTSQLRALGMWLGLKSSPAKCASASLRNSPSNLASTQT